VCDGVDWDADPRGWGKVGETNGGPSERDWFKSALLDAALVLGLLAGVCVSPVCVATSRCGWENPPETSRCLQQFPAWGIVMSVPYRFVIDRYRNIYFQIRY